MLLDAKGRRHLAVADGPMARAKGFAAVDLARLRAHVGRRLSVGGASVLVLTPSTADLWETMGRGPQAFARKDLGALVLGADVVAGCRVAEAGCGSGAATLTLARAVGPTGRVISLDLREESLATASANVERAGLAGRVEFRVADVRAGIAERDLDAVVLDIPDPWAAVPAAWDALRPCGHLATFSPNMEQVKETAKALRAKPFVDVRTIEVIEREMEVRDVGVRPSHAALGHTGYLTFARKVLDTF